ncbi:MAG: hypothetical protein IKZ09_04160 [Clostridia bacterium]|nr:hypothetical protein [Clostridia bacterium]
MMDVMRCLTEEALTAIRGCGVRWEEITDIRLRAGSCSSLSYLRGGQAGHLPFAGLRLCEEALRTVLSRLCAGSVHVYDEGLLRGYFSPQMLPGVRVGAAGRLLSAGSKPERLQNLTSLCIRLPHAVSVSTDVSRYLAAVIRGGDVGNDGDVRHAEGRGLSSVLFYAPPGEGKTTLLRCLIRSLCASDVPGGPISAAVLDSSEELCGAGSDDCTVDRFCGYPRGLAMEIATRAFAPQVIFCDEIGSEAEAEEILRAQACGIPLIATAHADTLASLLRRPCFARLYENGVFARYIRLRRGGDGDFVFCEEAG